MSDQQVSAYSKWAYATHMSPLACRLIEDPELARARRLEIYKARKLGVSVAELARQHGVSRRRIYQILCKMPV